MKKIFLSVLCILSIGIILSFPAAVISGVKSGIRLSLYQVIPALFPFILIANIITSQNLTENIARIFYPVLHGIYGLSPNGTFAMILSFLSGFPMGAKTISELYQMKKLSFSESAHLMTFCNNCSLSFVVNYIGFSCLCDKVPVSELIFFIYLPPALTGLINRFFFSHKTEYGIQQSGTNGIIQPAVASITKICVFVILFSTAVSLLQNWQIPYWRNLSSLFEITTGLKYITENGIFPNTFFCVILSAVFGGISTMAQCFSFISDAALKKFYIYGKLEQCLITVIMISTAYLFK